VSPEQVVIGERPPGAFAWEATLDDGTTRSEGEVPSISALPAGEVRRVRLRPRNRDLHCPVEVRVEPGVGWRKFYTRTVELGGRGELPVVDSIGLAPPPGGSVYLHVLSTGVYVLTTDPQPPV
jgi:hypothetical protein